VFQDSIREPLKFAIRLERWPLPGEGFDMLAFSLSFSTWTNMILAAMPLLASLVIGKEAGAGISVGFRFDGR
jgi:hypothetical protein